MMGEKSGWLLEPKKRMEIIGCESVNFACDSCESKCHELIKAQAKKIAERLIKIMKNPLGNIEMLIALNSAVREIFQEIEES